MKARFALALAIVLSLGCNLQPGPTGVKPKGKPKPKPSASASASPAPAVLPLRQPIPLSEPPRIIDSAPQTVELIGKVKLNGKIRIISDNGASIISDNGASIISNGGGNIISDNGASIISDNGASVISNNASNYVLLQAGGTSAVPESLLADAQIEVLDAAGNVLVTPDKKPITATTDKQGNYKLTAKLPNENLILRVRLFNGGQLFAFTTKDKRTGPVTLDINTASSLGTAYIMDKYVKKQQPVLDLLPGLEAEKLQADMEAARIHTAGEALALQPAELIEIADRLRTKEPRLDQTIKRIEAILLAGQKNLGTGLKANQISLGSPIGVVADSQGNFFIAEGTAGRIRQVAPDGTVSAFAGSGAPAGRDLTFGKITALIGKPDGTMYVIADFTKQVLKVTPDGTRTVVAGPAGAPASGQGALMLTSPRKLALAPDGSLYITDRDDKEVSRIFRVDPQGVLQAVALPQSPAVETVDAIAVDKDGNLWMYGEGETKFLARQKGGVWETVKDELEASASCTLAAGADGSVFLTDELAAKVLRLDTAGTLTTFAGTGISGNLGDGGPAVQAQLNAPESVWPAPDGKVYIADKGNGLIRVVGKDGVISTFAGVQGFTQVGDALTAAINQPGGVAVDAQGRLVVSETSAHLVKRLEGKTLVRIAGSNKGFSGDGGAATTAQLNGPSGLAIHGDTTYVLDTDNGRIRKIDAAGVITTIAGSGSRDSFGSALKVPALEANLTQLLWLTISPDGVPYWSDAADNAIFRLKDGFVERVAGIPGKEGDKGDGGPAIDAELNMPFGLAFDKAGNLYVADTGNLRVRKIDTAGTITTYAGMPIAQVLTAVFSGKADQNGAPATQTPVWAPVGLAVDAQGTLFISELGTTNTNAFKSRASAAEGGGLLGALPLDTLPKTYARIRKVTADGKLVNVTGPGTSLLSDTSGDNMLLAPTGLAFDQEGRLVAADAGLNQLKMLPKGSF